MPRRIRWPAFLFFVAFFAPAAFAADEPVQTPAPYETPVAPKVICKTEQAMGTKIKKKTCRTQAQADADRQASQVWLKKIQHEATLQTTSAQ
jgi:hypothetical protein